MNIAEIMLTGRKRTININIERGVVDNTETTQKYILTPGTNRLYSLSACV